jgi:hypothetical protein
MKRKNKKLKGIKQLRKGGNTGYSDYASPSSSTASQDFATQAVSGGQTDYGDGGGTPTTTTQTTQAKKDTGARGFLDTTTTALNLIGKGLFDVSGVGLAVKAAKTVGPKVREVLTPSTTKKTADARLSGSFTTTYAKKPQPTTTTYTGGDSEPIIKKPIEAIKQVMPTETLTAKKFFPFRAYRNGGVPSGPPPKRGPNPQVPPVKLRNGGVKTNSKKSVSMRGIGKAIRGTKFSGVY